jgi:ubiquinone/menaquinone biosynthesis C-methylase UbiE
MFFLNYSTVIDRILRDLRVYIPEFSGIKAGDTILDVCCGTGDLVYYYVKKGAIATGIDLNPDMLKLAERNKKKSGVKDASFQIADASNLPFQDNVFDFASISLALHPMEQTARDRVISEMKRVVKKKSTLIFADFQVPLPQNVFRYLAKAIEFMAGGEHYRNFKDFISQGGLDELLMRNQLQMEKRGYLKAGLIAIIKVQNT